MHIPWGTSKNPLLLLAVSSGITFFLAPFVSNTWQNHEQALKNRNELVQQMSTTSARILFAVQRNEFQGKTSKDPVRKKAAKQAALDAFGEWDQESQSVSAKLASYPVEHRTRLTRAWNAYSLAILCYYNLVDRPGVIHPHLRRITVRGLATYLQGTSYSFAKVLTPVEQTEGIGLNLAYQQAWRHLKLDLIEKKDEMVGSVLNGKSPTLPAGAQQALDAC